MSAVLTILGFGLPFAVGLLCGQYLTRKTAVLHAAPAPAAPVSNVTLRGLVEEVEFRMKMTGPMCVVSSRVAIKMRRCDDIWITVSSHDVVDLWKRADAR